MTSRIAAPAEDATNMTVEGRSVTRDYRTDGLTGRVCSLAGRQTEQVRDSSKHMAAA